MQYESRQELMKNTSKDEDAGNKLGSARPDNDFLNGGSSATTGSVPAELIAADQRPYEVRPREALPVETQAVDFITPESRPREIRPREAFPTEAL